MSALTRREFLGRAAGAAAAVAATMAVGPSVLRAAPATSSSASEELFITNWYQFNAEAMHALSGEHGLPNGAKYLHLFAHSAPGTQPRPEMGKLAHSGGSSFKCAHAFDVNKYKGWLEFDDAQLKQSAIEYREAAFKSDSDYFAFNEMPTTGPEKPHVRDVVAKWLRHLHEAGGGRKLRGIFYFTEHNVMAKEWQGEVDEFWSSIDETCDLVGGEHYHSYEFVLGQKTPEGLAEHLFAQPKRMLDSGKPAQVNIAQKKYCVLHSSYYGPKDTSKGWCGVQSTKHDEKDLKEYVDFVIAATRASDLGKQRIAFGPLATQE